MKTIVLSLVLVFGLTGFSVAQTESAQPASDTNQDAVGSVVVEPQSENSAAIATPIVAAPIDTAPIVTDSACCNSSWTTRGFRRSFRFGRRCCRSWGRWR